MLDAYWRSLTFDLPPPRQPGNCWYQIVNTALPAPKDFCSLEIASAIQQGTYWVAPRTSVVLMTRPSLFKNSS